MARTSPLHHLGTFFLLAAAILLLITTISAPVIGDIAILKVTLANSSDIRHSSVTFGTFGHCVLDVAPKETDQDYCYPKSVEYKPADVMEVIDGVWNFFLFFFSLSVYLASFLWLVGGDHGELEKKAKSGTMMMMADYLSYSCVKRHRIQQSRSRYRRRPNERPDPPPHRLRGRIPRIRPQPRRRGHRIPLRRSRRVRGVGAHGGSYGD